MMYKGGAVLFCIITSACSTYLLKDRSGADKSIGATQRNTARRLSAGRSRGCYNVADRLQGMILRDYMDLFITSLLQIVPEDTVTECQVTEFIQNNVFVDEVMTNSNGHIDELDIARLTALWKAQTIDDLFVEILMKAALETGNITEDDVLQMWQNGTRAEQLMFHSNTSGAATDIIEQRSNATKFLPILEDRADLNVTVLLELLILQDYIDLFITKMLEALPDAVTKQQVIEYMQHETFITMMTFHGHTLGLDISQMTAQWRSEVVKDLFVGTLMAAALAVDEISEDEVEQLWQNASRLEDVLFHP